MRRPPGVSRPPLLLQAPVVAWASAAPTAAAAPKQTALSVVPRPAGFSAAAGSARARFHPRASEPSRNGRQRRPPSPPVRRNPRGHPFVVLFVLQEPAQVLQRQHRQIFRSASSRRLNSCTAGLPSSPSSRRQIPSPPSRGLVPNTSISPPPPVRRGVGLRRPPARRRLLKVVTPRRHPPGGSTAGCSPAAARQQHAPAVTIQRNSPWAARGHRAILVEPQRRNPHIHRLLLHQDIGQVVPLDLRASPPCSAPLIPTGPLGCDAMNSGSGQIALHQQRLRTLVGIRQYPPGPRDTKIRISASLASRLQHLPDDRRMSSRLRASTGRSPSRRSPAAPDAPRGCIPPRPRI